MRARACVSALALCFVGVGARGQSCEIYFESFDRFNDPTGFDDGVFAAGWCRNGARIASNSFCNSGGALRLGSAVDDPVLWIYVGDQACSTVTIEFDYAQFADTGTRLYASGSIDPGFNCNASISQLAGALTTTGGVCTRTTLTVSPNGAQSIYFRFDHGVNGNAIYIDNLAIRVDGCCDGQQQPCDATGGPGCDDQTVQDCVCEQDPYCCDVA